MKWQIGAFPCLKPKRITSCKLNKIEFENWYFCFILLFSPPSADERPQYASIQAIFFGPYLLAGLTSSDWDINAINSTSMKDWIAPIPASSRSQLVSLSQQSNNNTFFLSNADFNLTMDQQQPKPGTDEAVHATFRLVRQDPSRLDTRHQNHSIGQYVMLEPFGLPGMVVTHQGPNNYFNISAAPAGVKSVFKVVPGLDGDQNSVSFESRDSQGCFIHSQSADVMLMCKNNGGAEFDRRVSFTMSGGLREYHPVSFAAKGVRRNFLLEPLLSLRDESYTLYFNIGTWVGRRNWSQLLLLV